MDFVDKIEAATVGGLFSLTDTVLLNGVSVRANTMVLDKRYESEDMEISRNILMALLLSYLFITQYTLNGMSREYIFLDFDERGRLLLDKKEVRLRVCLDMLASALLVPKTALKKLLSETKKLNPEIGYSEIIHLIMRVFHVTYNLAVFRYEYVRCMDMNDPDHMQDMSFVELEESL